jgi:hypothetical protein
MQAVAREHLVSPCVMVVGNVVKGVQAAEGFSEPAFQTAQKSA